MTEEILIKNADHGDIKAMMAINEQNLVENNPTADFSKIGFLIRRLTYDNAKSMIDDAENSVCLLAKRGDEGLGYLTGYDISKITGEFAAVASQLEEIKPANGKVFYHNQIAKKPGAKNIGGKLLLRMFDEVKNRGYHHIICKIVHDPYYNEISIKFHHGYGFKRIGWFVDDGVKVGIYLKEI